ncbi:hypothetical protein EV175_004009 [Coemansia sp. RSA 1933]|nr:hypothetical protein EV175_004009 [Coemansia sp. RSA 1933]
MSADGVVTQMSEKSGDSQPFGTQLGLVTAISTTGRQDISDMSLASVTGIASQHPFTHGLSHGSSYYNTIQSLNRFVYPTISGLSYGGSSTPQYENVPSIRVSIGDRISSASYSPAFSGIFPNVTAGSILACLNKQDDTVVSRAGLGASSVPTPGGSGSVYPFSKNYSLECPPTSFPMSSASSTSSANWGMGTNALSYSTKDSLYPMAIQHGQHVASANPYSGNHLRFAHGSQTQGYYGCKSDANELADSSMQNYRYQGELGDVFQLGGGDSKYAGLTAMSSNQEASAGVIRAGASTNTEPSSYLRDIPGIGLPFNTGTISPFHMGGTYGDHRNDSELSKSLSESAQAECAGVAEAFDPLSTIETGEAGVDISASLSGSSVVNNALLSLTGEVQKLGHIWRNKPSTEVVVTAVEQFGTELWGGQRYQHIGFKTSAVDITQFDVPAAGDINRNDRYISSTQNGEGRVKWRSGVSMEAETKYGINNKVSVGDSSSKVVHFLDVVGVALSEEAIIEILGWLFGIVQRRLVAKMEQMASGNEAITAIVSRTNTDKYLPLGVDLSYRFGDAQTSKLH